MFYETYTDVVSVLIPTRLSEDDVARIDALVASGLGDTRSDVVGRAVALLDDTERRRRIGEQIAESYRQMPEDDEFGGLTERNASDMIEQEPW